MNYIRISLSFANGTIGIMSFVTDDGTLKRDADEKNINETIEKSNFESPVISWRIIKENEIPKDRTFRNAWIDTGKIEHDMKKVKEIHIDHIREERAYLLADLDTEFIKALGQKDTAKADKIEAEKQRLRDLPALLSVEMQSAETIEEVTAFTVAYKEK